MDDEIESKLTVYSQWQLVSSESAGVKEDEEYDFSKKGLTDTKWSVAKPKIRSCKPNLQINISAGHFLINDCMQCLLLWTYKRSASDEIRVLKKTVRVLNFLLVFLSWTGVQ